MVCVDETYSKSALLAAVRDKPIFDCCHLRLDHTNQSLLYAGGYRELFAVTCFGCALLCAQIVFAQAVSQTHHRHHLEVLQGQPAEPDTGCGYSGSKVIFTALYGTTVRTPWLNCAVESAMLKRGNDSVIVLTDSIEQFKESWPGSLPSPAQLVDVPSCLTNTPLQHWLESPELAAAVFRQQNIANALRLAAIYKNGGAYLDLVCCHQFEQLPRTPHIRTDCSLTLNMHTCRILYRCKTSCSRRMVLCPCSAQSQSAEKTSGSTMPISTSLPSILSCGSS